MAEPGFGNSPRSFSVRAIAVGHASARWRGASSHADADRRNFDLSTKRSDAVLSIVRDQILAQMGANFPIEFDTSTVTPRVPVGATIGSYGDGSREALLNKPRTDNSDRDRRVELKLEKIVTNYTAGGVSLAPRELPGRTKDWGIGVTRLRMTAVGASIGSVEVRLRNRLTDKVMYATANLYGGGIGGGVAKAAGITKLAQVGAEQVRKQFVNQVKNHLAQAAADFIGRGEVFFSTSAAMGFGDWDDQWIRVGKVMASAVIKATFSYVVFPSLTHNPGQLVIQKSFSLGLIDLEGWVTTGVLTLRGIKPSDTWTFESDGIVEDSYDRVWQDSLIVNFATGKHDASAKSGEIRQFMRFWLDNNF